LNFSFLNIKRKKIIHALIFITMLVFALASKH